MSFTIDLDPGLRDVALALGVAKTVNGSLTLNMAFFGAPGQYVRNAVSDDTQRAALLSALERWLVSAQPTLPGNADDAAGDQRNAYPLLDDDLPGQVYVVVATSGSGTAQVLQLSIAAEAAVADGGPAVRAELALLTAGQGHLQPVALTPAYPMRIEASSPVTASAGGARLTATLRIVAPPHESECRLDVRLDGLPGGAAPVVFDLGSGAPPLARIVTMVLDVLLAQLDPGAPEAVTRAAAALPTLLGLLPGFPPLPFDQVARDPTAMRRWLAQVVVARTDSGGSMLVAWFDAIGTLMGADTLPLPRPTGTEDDPALVPLLAGGAGVPTLTLEAAVRADVAGGAPILLLGLRLALTADAPFDASLNAEALLLALPLQSGAPPTVLERLDLRLDTPAAAAQLLDPADTGGTLGVRALRAGLRYASPGGVASGQGSVVPVLELLGVALQVGPVSHTFDRLDLTHADSLTEAAQGLLSDAIDAGLGGAAPVVEALRTLLGLATTPGLDFALMATAPTRALARYYRALRAGADGWKPLVAAIGRLLGNTDDTVTGIGTRTDPWCAPIELLAAPDGSPLALQVAIWDEGDALTPQWTLALRAHAATGLGALGGAVQANATVCLLQIDLPEAGNGAVRWLDAVRLDVAVTPASLQAGVDALSVAAQGVRAQVAWRPGQALKLGAAVTGIALSLSDGRVADDPDNPDASRPDRLLLGDLALPPTAFDVSRDDLGLGLDPAALWQALRWLFTRAAGHWVGPQARALLAVAGLFDSPPSAQPGDGIALPALQLPAHGGLNALLADPLDSIRGWLVGVLSGGPDVAGSTAAVRCLLEALAGMLAAPGIDGVVQGSGAPDDPWQLGVGAAMPGPLALQLWLEPAGPPRAVLQDTLDALAAGGLDAPSLLAALLAVRGAAPWLADALHDRDLDASGAALAALADTLTDTDGVLPAGLALPMDGDWELGTPVAASHLGIVAHGDALVQVRARVAARATALAPAPVVTLLLAPAWSADPAWMALLAGIAPADVSQVTLRVAGIAPALVDLGGVTASDWIVVDLADDGDGPRSDAAALLDRVLDAVLRTRPGARAMLVAHSYLGLVALACAAKRPADVAGLVTLAAPLGLGPELRLADPTQADALRLCRALVPSGVGGPLGETMALAQAWLAGRAAPGSGLAAPATTAWRPVGALPPALAGLSGLCITASVSDGLLDALAGAVVRDIGALAAPPTPTHLCWGVRQALALPAAHPNEPQADIALGLRLGSLALQAGAALPAGGLDVRARIGLPGGWLVGAPGDGGALAAAVRWAEFRGRVACGAPGPQVAVSVRLHDASLRGTVLATAGLDDAPFAELFDALLCKLDTAPAHGGHVDTFLDALAAIGVMRRAAGGAPAAALADGLQALRTDAATRLGGAIPPLLDRSGGWLGLARAAGVAAGAGGPWQLSDAPLPFECVVESNPWRVTVRSSGAGWPLDATGALDISGTVTLSAAQPAVHGQLGSPGFALGRAAPDAPFTLSGAWLPAPVTLWPAAPAATAAALAECVPSLLVNAGATLLMEQHFRGGVRIGSLHGLLSDPGGWIRTALVGTSGLPAAAPINALLASVQALLQLVDPLAGGAGGIGLALPGGLRIAAADVVDAGVPSLRLALATTAPLVLDADGASLDLGLLLDLDAHGQVRPGGALTLHLPLPVASTWQSLDIHFGADANGLQAGVSTASGVDLKLLPTVSGLDTLASAATGQLLPMLLDRLSAALDARTPRPEALDDALAVAAALGVCDAGAAIGSRFAARGQALSTFIGDLSSGHLQAQAPAIGAAVTTVLQRLFGAPISAAANPGGIGLRLAGVLGGSVALDADFSTQPVGVRLHAQGLELGAVTTDVEVGLVAGTFVAAVDLRATIDTGIGLLLSPRISAAFAGTANPLLQVDFRPVGDDTLVIELSPQPRPPTPEELLNLAGTWLIPLAGTALLRAAGSLLDTELWPGAGRSIEDLLVGSQLVLRSPAGALSVVAPLPAPPFILRGILDGLSGADVALPGGFTLRMVHDANLYGLTLGGEQQFDLGDYSLALRLGLPAALDPGWAGRGDGVGVMLLDLTDPATPKLEPVLRLGGLGVRFGRSEASDALIDVGMFRLGAVAGYVSADLALAGAGAPKLRGNLLGAVELDGLGLTLGGGDNSGNPVAASLLKSDDAGGDSSPANPPFDLLVATSDQGPVIRFGGKPELRIDVRRQFGPLYLADIGLIYDPQQGGPGRLGVGVDATVALAGLNVEIDGLTLFVPLDHPAELNRWALDLAGLSVSYTGSSVQIAGGLLKAQLATTVEYRGAISVQVAGRGLSALGAYARPTDAQGGYTSLFIFLAISAPLGGPPYLFITGVAGGAGLNRRLLTPRDPVLVPSFPLVQAMTGGSGDPMDELQAIGTDIPPERGAFWLAAGVRFSTFELLHTTALLTVAIDRGFEITLMGLMQLSLPPADEAMIVSVELALAAKYSTVDQVLSVRAALTQNSWLLSRDCQLTGGFAFVVWFARPEVLLSIGGYSSKLQVPDYYPDVPRVGFHWNVGEGIVVKGENFFAITHSAAMVGGALEASYHIGPINAWFSASLDVIVWWDPLRYEADAQIEVGVEILVQGCCFGVCVSLPPLHFSQGAWLTINGPPLAGQVVVDVGVAKFTVPFGHAAPPASLTWDEVRDKYLCGGVAGAQATTASVAVGGLPAPGSADGTAGAPWIVALEFALRVESRMPLSAWKLGAGALQSPAFTPASVDVVPAGPALGPVHAAMGVTLERLHGGQWTALDAAALAALMPTPAAGRFPGAVWDGGIKTHDADGRETVDMARPMLAAMGAVELRNTITLVEATGQLADLALATMIEEETPLPLPFGAAVIAHAVPARQRAAVATKPVARVAAAMPAAIPHPVPSLQASVPAAHLARAQASAPTRNGHLVEPGGAQLWRVPGEVAHTLALHGAARRVIGLSGSGAVLSDVAVAAADHALPTGVRSVVVTDAHAGAVQGWELATRLLQADACVLLAPGCTVLLAGPWAPPPRPNSRALPRWVEASAMSAGNDVVTTRFAAGAGAAPSTILVRLDPRVASASLDTLGLSVAGGRLLERTVIRHGARVELLCKVSADPKADALSLVVRCGAEWRLAGVLAGQGVHERWLRDLGARPHLRLGTPAPAAKPARVQLKRRKELAGEPQ